MNYGSSTRSWKPWIWMRLDLIFSMRNIYINSSPNPLRKFTSSSRSTEFKDILPWSISQIITKIILINTRIVKSNAMKQDIPLWIWKVYGNWDNNMIKIFRWRESHCRTNASVRRKEEVQKSRTMRIAVWGPCRKVNHLSKVIWDKKIITEFTRIGNPVLMMEAKVSKPYQMG